MPIVPEIRSPRSRRVGLALCLSGGGYRAAIYHLGAMLRLHECGLLRRVERISSVSGGSIVAAWYASAIIRQGAGRNAVAYSNWCDALDFRAVVLEPFRAIAATDIRTGPVLKSLLLNFVWPRFGAPQLARSYARLITPAPLSALPDAPNFVFCATDLTFGVNFELSKQRVGDYQAGYLQPDDVDGRKPGDYPIALAVAASSCFPPVFGPLRLDTRGLHFTHGAYDGPDRDALRAAIDLSDGGVYDNLATEPVIKHADEILVSDGGAPFPFRAGGRVLSRLLRYTAVIGNQAVALRKRLFHEMRDARGLRGTLWSIGRAGRTGTFGYSDQLVASTLARVRTDLDRFTDAEFEVLVNHGYGGCAAALESGDHADAARYAPPPRWPFPRWADEGVVEQALASSHRRFSPARLLGSLR
jgi:NTE family protein